MSFVKVSLNMGYLAKMFHGISMPVNFIQIKITLNCLYYSSNNVLLLLLLHVECICVCV